MQCSIRVSAFRRELNSHDAVMPREDRYPLQRTWRQVPVECKWAERQSIIPSRQPPREMLRAGAAHNCKDKEPPCHIEPAHCVGSSGFQSVRRAAAISVDAPALGQVSRRLQYVARHGRQRGARSTCCGPQGITGPGGPGVGAHRAQRCLTPRSSGAPTAGHQGPA